GPGVAGYGGGGRGGRHDPPYPPHVHLANVVLSGTSERRVAEAAQAVVRWLGRLFEDQPASRADLLGPAPCPIAKVRGRWRWHFLLRTPDAARLTQLANYLASHAAVPSSVRLLIDRDPVSLL